MPQIPTRSLLRPLAILPLILFALVACDPSQPPQPPQPAQPPAATLHHDLERANELSANRSELQIQAYMRRKSMDSLQSNGQGLYYRISGQPIGQQAAEGVRVAIAYTATLLDDTPCASADTIAPFEFVLGKRDAPMGLEEVVERMAPGQQAIAIIPPHLAYGLMGDRKNIPQNAAIVYRITWLRYPLQ
ncbi:MAG: hypothetical protein CSA97_04705 [Bacteroidetes bacterium]|nr:MAG: hypothetical protein CSA97_04705 [Bacteroidota bacterium]